MNGDYERLVAEHMDAPSIRSEADRLEFMKISRLDRIADALERISDNLDSISASLESLGNCTTKKPERNPKHDGDHLRGYRDILNHHPHSKKWKTPGGT